MRRPPIRHRILESLACADAASIGDLVEAYAMAVRTVVLAADIAAILTQESSP